MASDQIKGKLQRLKAAQLLALCAGFNLSAKNGTEAFKALSDLEDQDLQEAIDLLNDPNGAAAADQVPAQTDDSEGKLDPAKLYKIRLRKGTDRDLHYNGGKYVASTDPKRCSLMPAHVADHYLQWFADNDLPIFPVIAVAKPKD